jgi:hypothetical protein
MLVRLQCNLQERNRLHCGPVPLLLHVFRSGGVVILHRSSSEWDGMSKNVCVSKMLSLRSQVSVTFPNRGTPFWPPPQKSPVQENHRCTVLHKPTPLSRKTIWRSFAELHLYQILKHCTELPMHHTNECTFCAWKYILILFVHVSGPFTLSSWSFTPKSKTYKSLSYSSNNNNNNNNNNLLRENFVECLVYMALSRRRNCKSIANGTSHPSDPKGYTLLNMAHASLSLCSYIKQWCHPIIPWLAFKRRCYRHQYKIWRRREPHNDLCNQNSLTRITAHASRLTEFALKLMTWRQLIFKENVQSNLSRHYICSLLCCLCPHTSHTYPSHLLCIIDSVICVQIAPHIERCHPFFSVNKISNANSPDFSYLKENKHNLIHFSICQCSRGSVAQETVWSRAAGPRFDSLQRQAFSPTSYPDRFWVCLPSKRYQTSIFSEQGGRSIDLATHVHLVPILLHKYGGI